MLSFKSNCIEEVPEESLSPGLGWLILTDNKIRRLPKSIGALKGLRKCMLAANELTELPGEMENCRDIELLRIAANKLATLPDWLLRLPKLSWLAFAGNPCSAPPALDGADSGLAHIKYSDLRLAERLGEGASGVVYKAALKSSADRVLWEAEARAADRDAASECKITEEEVAVKMFKAGATSDGLPEDEMRAMTCAGQHPHCTGVLGTLVEAPDQALGLVLPLIPPTFRVLGGPPSFQSVTRDTFPAGAVFGIRAVLRVLRGVASVCAHLHSKHISHGDLYAHNILVARPEDESCGSHPPFYPVLSDFGAASFYGRLGQGPGKAVQAIESRAFGCLAEDLLQRLGGDSFLEPNRAESSAATRLWEVVSRCQVPEVNHRPLFSELLSELDEVGKML